MREQLLKLIEIHHSSLEAGDPATSASIFTDDLVAVLPTGTVHGADGILGVLQAFATAFPDLKVTQQAVWVEGDTAIAELVFSGTHTGPLGTAEGEVPPTGKFVTFPLIDIFVLRGDKISEHRVYWDNASFLGQLGLLGS
ncbi:ester cyclase [Actinocorallia sp. API 0066]|uniref:ester cyclase n=1 Tax=Actinocorallia sp. API 0066 TaxID=2896846 RepID=UPI001E2F56AD|nr:ester cyclase [Actinocorallia sp. API 0066]MCD0452802.1 ester cyclase [Actinocorallia sp. API 0066]